MSIEGGKSRHRRRTRAQWRHVIATQASSGVSQLAYCQRHGISYSSFCRWKRELMEAGQLSNTPIGNGFVELTPMEPVAAPGWDVELELGEGVYLRVRRG